ncbi:MAG: UDP-N-acetylmuramoyl-tripeptide--D-alanyl-D-alanine ligase, partial [Burkholderiales bacterium]|nr:UDP-N-acetylmuramoyl-tripeptide--D-alanyl-D-alanine ligase [Burkholderiales bacterium]
MVAVAKNGEGLLAGVAQTARALSAATVSGNTYASWQGVTTDSRQVEPGNLFIALRGERFDAHDFLDQVQLAGATVLVVERLPEGLQLLPQVAAIVVPDTRRALQELGAAWRRQFALPLIAVTGSNGKTTVKEMIASVLQAAFGANYALATQGNLNNDLGVPLSALRLHAGHKAAVLELGMNHPGEIALLASIAQANVALVNNAQREHQEFMESVAAVAAENGSVLQALPPFGVAVFPYGDEFTPLWQEYAGTRPTLHFGLDAAADVSCTFQAQEFGALLQVVMRDPVQTQTFSLQLQAAGEHNVRNALAAIACCHAAGIELSAIIAGLENFAPVKGRLQRKAGKLGQCVIDDTYNANPDSVRAAIDVLAKTAGNTMLVLGDMGEVGDNG